MSDTSTARSGGMGFVGWLTLVFIVLKINPGSHLDSPVQDWSWWLVLSPILICLALVGVVLLGIGVVFVVSEIIDRRAAAKRRKQRVQNRLR